jgi:hypothetical protein
MKYYTLNIASVYGSCTYGGQQYDKQGNCSTAAQSGGSTGKGHNGGGLLSNTGFDFALVATLVCVVAFTALVVQFARRPNHAKQEATNKEK